MAKNDIGGVWRTVGGRRIFIKDGQDLSSAMKESGKFKTTTKANEDVETGKNTSEKQNYSKMSDQELRDELEHNRNMENEMNRRLSGRYELSDEKRDELERRAMHYESTKDEIRDELRSRKGMGPVERDTEKDYQKYNKWLKSQGVDKQLTEAEYNKMSLETEKTINKGLERSIEMEKDNLARRKKNGDSVENISNKTRNIHDMELEKQRSDERLARLKNEDFARKLDKEDIGKWVDNSKSNKDGSYSEIYQSQGSKGNPFKKGEWVRYDYDKNGKRESVQSYKTLEEAKAGKTNNGSNDWIRNAFNEYKKEHPNTKMTLEQFKKSKK